MEEIKKGTILIAKHECSASLILKKEYEVYSINQMSGLLVIKSEQADAHYFCLSSEDSAYWGKYFYIKSQKPTECSETSCDINMNRQQLYEAYNATSTANPEGSDELESYEHWLERQLLSRIKKLENLENQNNILRSMYNGAIDDLNWERNNKKAAHEEEVKKLISFLEDHEQWEADFISENKLWWPNRASDVLTGEIYDKWMQLQAKRNQLLNLYSADRNKV